MEWERDPSGAMVPAGTVPRGIDELAEAERRRWQELGHQARDEGPVAADNLGYTAGSGASIASDDIGGVHYQRIKPQVGADGSAADVSKTNPLPVAAWPSGPVYAFVVPNQVHVASASNPAWDLWNADGALIVRVISIRQIPDIVTAVTGVSISWLLERSTNVGTGGTALTAWLPDTSDTALDADITCRSKPAGGAAAGTDLFPFALSSEETNAGTMQIASMGGLELVPASLVMMNKGIVLRPSQGIRMTQVTSSSVGNTAWVITFTVE